ncbi:MAG: trypsin-like peptidase domain-containing protein [Gammaproteobacteria bacterium]|nr:trypsin-like peptidase domain-containing protein [Gammaproteobacteria bacterium]
MMQRRPLNHIIFCEKPWRSPALALLFLWLITATWAVYLAGIELDDFEFEHFAIRHHPQATALPGMQAVATDTLTRLQSQISPAIAHIHNFNINANGGVPQVLASGVVINPEGYLVTTDHSLRGQPSVWVDIKEQNGISRYRGDIVRRDTASDLALIKLNKSKPQQNGRFLFLKLAATDAATVYALGLDTQSQVTGRVGGVMQRGVSINIGPYRLQQLWQSDAIYQWEQNGGPLVNEAAELLGINVALADNLGRLQGYVIPAAIIERAFGAQVGLMTATPSSRPPQSAQAVGSAVFAGPLR